MLFKKLNHFLVFLLWAQFGFSHMYLYEEPWGKDSGLKVAQSPLPPKRHSMPVQIAHQIIRFHQKVISPVDGPRSHFRPCSSQYMKEAMEYHGFFKGFFMGCDRLIRENSDEWVYRTVDIHGSVIKYDPAKDR